MEKSFINLSRAALMAPIFFYSGLPPPEALCSFPLWPAGASSPMRSSAHLPPRQKRFPEAPPPSAAPGTLGPFLTQTHTWQVSFCPLKRITGCKACRNGFARDSPSAFLKHHSTVKPHSLELDHVGSWTVSDASSIPTSHNDLVPLRERIPKRVARTRLNN